MLKKFALGDVFNIYSPKKRFNANAVYFGGKYPYVARGSSNNGIRGYITEDEQYLSPAKSLSFGQDTATVFYQPDAYFTGDKIKVMVLNNHELNDELAQYFITVITKSFSTFAWGQSSFNEKILKATEIVLPVIGSPDPDHEYTVDDIDFAYMQERIAELDAYLAASGLDDYELTDEDKEILSLSPESASDEAGASEADHGNGQVVSKAFKIGGLFDIVKGKRLTKNAMKPGNIPFISASAVGNGITAHIGNEENLHEGNKITVAYNGAVGSTFYQPDFFVASDDVNVLYPKFEMNERNALFIMAAIKKTAVGYSYTHKWDKAAMEESDMLLPITSFGDPDFAYMERYVRAIEKLAIADVVKYKDKLIDTTKQLVAE